MNIWKAPFMFIFGIVTSIFAGTSVTYKTTTLPAALPTTTISITSIVRLTSSPSGVVWITGRGANQVGYLLEFDGNTFTQAGGNLFPDGFGRYQSVDTTSRLIEGVFLAQDQQLMMASTDGFSDGRGVKSARAVQTVGAVNPAITNVCNDSSGIYFVGELPDTSALLGSGPDPSSDGNSYVSAVRSPNNNRTVGVYQFGKPTYVSAPGVSGLFCSLSSVFMTDNRYDIVHVAKEAAGTFIAERWLQNTTGNLNTEIVRHSATGAASVLASTNSSSSPVLQATQLSGLVSDPTGKTFAFPYQSADGKFHVMVIQNGVMKEVASFQKSDFASIMVQAASGDWVLFATGLGQTQWTTLRAVNTVSSTQAIVASPGNINGVGITITSVDPAQAGIDASGKVYFTLPGIVDRSITATITVTPDLLPPSLDPVSPVLPGSTFVLTGKNLSQVGATTSVLLQGNTVPFSATAQGLSITAPFVAGTYSIQVNVAGFGQNMVSNTITITVTPAIKPAVISAITPVFTGTLQPLPTSFTAGEAVTVWGTGLSQNPLSQAPSLPLPTELARCNVVIDNTRLARMYFASEGQINVFLPPDLATGLHTLSVTRLDNVLGKPEANSQAITLTIVTTQPTYVTFTAPEDGKEYIAVQRPDYSFMTPGNGVVAGEVVILYATGLGAKIGTVPDGDAPKAALAAQAQVTATFGNVSAQVLYAGTQPDFPGLDQINIQLPTDITVGADGFSVLSIQVGDTTPRQFRVKVR